jgi:hypothetical protein
LRDLLRQTTAQLRAAQDGQAAAQATLEQEKQKSAAIQKQLDDLLAHPVQPSMTEDAIAKMKADLKESQDQVTQLTAGLNQTRDAYQKAVEFARAKDASERAAVTRATESDRQAAVCAQANTKLSGVANDILHLYRTPEFRSLLFASREPLLGLKKVELENTIQDYEDKIADQKYIPAREPPK